VLRASSALTDRQKLTAEHFNDKFRSLPTTVAFLAKTRRYTLDEYVFHEFLTNLAAFDTGIAAWYFKRRYDAVRPFSAIHYLYRGRTVTAWGGPGRGTVTDLPGEQWRSYLTTQDHPEYPSGTASICAAHAQASRRFTGTDSLGLSVTIRRGAGGGAGPPRASISCQALALWTEWAQDCARSDAGRRALSRRGLRAPHSARKSATASTPSWTGTSAEQPHRYGSPPAGRAHAATAASRGATHSLAFPRPPNATSEVWRKGQIVHTTVADGHRLRTSLPSLTQSPASVRLWTSIPEYSIGIPNEAVRHHVRRVDLVRNIIRWNWRSDGSTKCQSHGNVVRAMGDVGYSRDMTQHNPDYLTRILEKSASDERRTRTRPMPTQVPASESWPRRRSSKPRSAPFR
jgi:hypothetical protein